LRREWNTECDKPTTGPENGGQPEEEHGNLSDGGSLFQRMGAGRWVFLSFSVVLLLLLFLVDVRFQF